MKPKPLPMEFWVWQQVPYNEGGELTLRNKQIINLNGGGVEEEVPDESKEGEVTWLRWHWVLGKV